MPLYRFGPSELFACGEPLSSVQKMLARVLLRFAPRVREVQVAFRDENGPKGGVDKRCRVELRMFPRGILIAHGQGESAYAALRTACSRLKVLLGKRRPAERLRGSVA